MKLYIEDSKVCAVVSDDHVGGQLIDMPEGFKIEDVGKFNVVDGMLVPSIPKEVTPRQARLALLQATLLDEVELLLVNDKAMQIWWEYSLDIKRDHPHIIAMGTALGMTEAQLDELFILAGSL